MLVEHAFAWARAHGHRRARLWSDVKFTRAHVMYERLGFVRTGIRDCEDLDRSREHGYEMPLPGATTARGDDLGHGAPQPEDPKPLGHGAPQPEDPKPLGHGAPQPEDPKPLTSGAA
jgi:hypothetical protein